MVVAWYCLWSLGKYNEAIKDYTMALQIDPKSIIAHNYRGLIYSKLKKYEEAIKDFDKVIEH